MNLPGKQHFKAVMLLAAMLCLPMERAAATTFLELQSTALGGGWFQYRMTVNNDPFFSEADITQLQIGFTNEIGQSSASTNWVNDSWDNSYSSWKFNSGFPARPYTETFMIRSSKTAYRLGTTGARRAIVAFSLYCTDMNPLVAPGGSRNIVGYAWMPCLIPCDPSEADGSPATFDYRLKLVPDVNIHELIRTNGGIYGVDFDWDYQSTFVLQGSTDFNAWTNIAYIRSYPPETLWTTNVALGGFGSFFRVALVAQGYATNLPPMNSNLALAQAVTTKADVASPVIRCQPSNDKMTVTIATQTGQTYQVQALDSHQTVQQTQTITAQGASATVAFDADSLPGLVFFQAVPIK